MPWEVVVRREVEALIDALQGKRAGYGNAVRQLEIDPCAEFERPDGDPRPFAYRLSGPLEPKVRGVRLKRDHRLAFTMRTPDRDDSDGIVEILFVGRRDTRDRAKTPGRSSTTSSARRTRPPAIFGLPAAETDFPRSTSTSSTSSCTPTPVPALTSGATAESASA